MTLRLDFCSSLCCTNVFTVNGVRADPEDFGEQHDHDSENAEEYGCGDMKFTRCPPTPDILRKYGITSDEYEVIAGKLEEGLSFGRCSWCI